MSFHPCFRRRWLLQVCLGKAFPQKHAFVDISVFLSLRKQQPRFAQGQPKKEFHRTTKAIAEMNADGRWRRTSMLSSMWQHVARLQFDSCADAFQGISYLDLCPLKCSLPFSPVESQWETAKSTLNALTLENPTTQLWTWQSVKSAKSPSSLNFTGPLPTDKIQGLWDPKRTSIQQKMSWRCIIHNAQTAAIFAWALSFCKVRIERSGLLRSWSRALSGNIISTRKERLNFCWKFVACSRCKSTCFQRHLRTLMK